LDPKKYKIPEDWPYEEARKLFQNPLVTDPSELNVNCFNF
jgi:flap endonuclease-1